MSLPQEIIRKKRDGEALAADEIVTLVRGLVDGSLVDAQVGAFAMAVVLNGMNRAETAALTRAMADSGRCLAWTDLPGPTVDKHSSGGIGDKVSLILAPLLAAAGCFVPMVSGRGLGHTGGTLDKLESFVGYDTRPDLDRFARVVREVGCTIVGQTNDLAPADRRLYAIRDVTATVESESLIVASILAKKLAVGAAGLVMDVKIGNGAFMTDLATARGLATAIAEVAAAAGLPTRCLLTDMNECLGATAGNALEVAEAVAFLKGDARDARLAEVTLALGAELLVMVDMAPDRKMARAVLQGCLDSGAAAERFARMIRALGGSGDPLHPSALAHAQAPVRLPVPSPAAGPVNEIRTRELGLLVIGLGGGRVRPDQAIDPSVGLSGVLGIGRKVEQGEPLAMVHARDLAAAEAAVARVAAAYRIGETPIALRPVVIEKGP
ncbi:MAG: thymidine phosphorylase [Geminicoccaceae bacterium]